MFIVVEDFLHLFFYQLKKNKKKLKTEILLEIYLKKYSSFMETAEFWVEKHDAGWQKFFFLNFWKKLKIVFLLCSEKRKVF